MSSQVQHQGLKRDHNQVFFVGQCVFVMAGGCNIAIRSRLSSKFFRRGNFQAGKRSLDHARLALSVSLLQIRKTAGST
jgi:hypothetical protein